MSNSRLDSYLNVLENGLAFLPMEERREWREEARQHLLELAAAHENLGLPPDKALQAALQQFGSAEQIGRQMACSVNPSLTGRVAVSLFSAPLIAAMLLLIGLAYAYVLTDSRLLFTWLQGVGTSAFLLVPTLGGWRVGLRLSPRQASLPVLRALALAGIGFFPIASVMLAPALGSPLDGAAPELGWGLLWFPLCGLSLCLARLRNRHGCLSA